MVLRNIETHHGPPDGPPNGLPSKTGHRCQGVTFGVTMRLGNGILLSPYPRTRHLKHRRLLTTWRSASTTILGVVIVTMPKSTSGNERSMMSGFDARTHSFPGFCCQTSLEPWTCQAKSAGFWLRLPMAYRVPWTRKATDISSPKRRTIFFPPPIRHWTCATSLTVGETHGATSMLHVIADTKVR
jgi:hypothetical protein